MKFIKLKPVMVRTGLSRSSIYSQAQQGKFPKPVKLSERSSAWVEEEVMEWIAERIEKRNETIHAADHPRMSTSEQEVGIDNE